MNNNNNKRIKIGWINDDDDDDEKMFFAFHFFCSIIWPINVHLLLIIGCWWITLFCFQLSKLRIVQFTINSHKQIQFIFNKFSCVCVCSVINVGSYRFALKIYNSLIPIHIVYIFSLGLLLFTKKFFFLYWKQQKQLFFHL